MIVALAILIVTALLVAVLEGSRRYEVQARWLAPVGVGLALVAALATEGLGAVDLTGAGISWEALLGGVGPSPYVSDAMATGLGAWCLLLGALWLLVSTGGATAGGVWARAAQVLVVAALYSLTHTWDLLFFGAQVVWLVPLVWAAGNAHGAPRTYRSVFALGAGALCLVGAILLIGRATGGQYSLGELSLSALTQWPLALVAVGAALWLGLAPFTGWSAQGQGRAATGILQTLVVGVPVVTLVLRLQQLITEQGLAGSVPEGWAEFTAALAWAGAITALIAGAGTLVHAGTVRWSGALTAFVSGLVAWGLGLDTPAGRFAALTILAAYGLGRVTLELVDARAGGHSAGARVAAVGASGLAVLSLVGIPITAGFVGLWLLAGALTAAGRSSVVLLAVGAAVLVACGAGLHYARQLSATRVDAGRSEANSSVAQWTGMLLGLALLIGGVLPGLWLPAVWQVASVAGGSIPSNTEWQGLADGGGLVVPPLLLGLAVVVIAALGRLVSAWMRSGGNVSELLLPPALDRLSRSAQGNGLTNMPTQLPVSEPVWWVSLAWFEGGLWGFGRLLLRLGTRMGQGLERLEGRYYLPLALIVMLVTLLAITR